MRDARDSYDSLTATLEQLQALAAVLPALPPVADHPSCMLSGLGHVMSDLIRQASADARALIDAKEDSHA